MVVNIRITQNDTNALVRVVKPRDSSDNFYVDAGKTHDGELWIPYESDGRDAWVIVVIGDQAWYVVDDNFRILVYEPSTMQPYNAIKVPGDTSVKMIISSQGQPISFQRLSN
eukprot:TRINITY_DN8015_c0_g1_i1.p1 TRINITY_DN8015_c0_g1~~TRINITY_DN8015_c0_g1_i1.p1  ORF type:complete len:112 (-),score=9.86 TRINITY_DN8015_c0_g1_i1:120-455(-)